MLFCFKQKTAYEMRISDWSSDVCSSDLDVKVPRKQRHTAKRVFDRLRDECGFTGGYTIIKDYMRERVQRRQAVFVPLSLPPSHAPAAFCEALVVIGGVVQQAAFFLSALPPSDVCFACASPAALAPPGVAWPNHALQRTR